MTANNFLKAYWSKWWVKYLILPLIILALLIIILVITFKLRHTDEPAIYGVSFSKPYAEELGLDWQAAYLALLNDIGIKRVRLMSYWDLHEPARDDYSFADLDWQFDEAERSGAKVSLAIGLRQPRWPECREPEWAKQLDDAQWQNQLLEYIAKVVDTYKNHPALESWQLENEFGNVDFGSHCRDFSRERLNSEFDMVKQLDPSHEIIMNQSNQVGLPLIKPHPDIYGFSVYKRIFEARYLSRYITHPTPAWYHSLRAQIVEMLHGKKVIIHELQAEPWTRGPITHTDFEEQQQTMSTRHLENMFDFANKTAIKTRYLWGGEWWYWRKETHQDASYWEIIKAEVNR